MNPKRITRDDPDYPTRLRDLPDTPAITVSAPLDVDAPRVAIVGSREPIDEARAYAYALAADLAASRIVVISGGAMGIDRAAHEGALDAGGVTWCVLPCGKDHVAPQRNADLFDRIVGSPPSAVVWPFRDDVECDKLTPRARNAVLVGLADAVVVIQAKTKSGSRNAATWARGFGRPVWVVPAAPWMREFEGSMFEIDHGARLLRSTDQLVRSLGEELVRAPSAKKSEALSELPSEQSWSEVERSVFSLLSGDPQHLDKIALGTGLTVPHAVDALLTLSMKNVVVEGPDGFFRRNSAG